MVGLREGLANECFEAWVLCFVTVVYGVLGVSVSSVLWLEKRVL